MFHPLTATQTLDRARAALQSGKGAGLPELLKIIETVSTNVGEATVQELAELIEKDATVLARIIQIANTIFHNPSFTPLSSLTHAIHQIGFSRVRSLTLSIMLIENAGSRNPPEQREAAAQALCAGLLAQGCALRTGMVDPDAAFAAAALRNFGGIILPAVSLEHYRAAQQRARRQEGDLAYRQYFGLTPLELSRHLLASARLPDEFIGALRDISPEALALTASTLETRLVAIADFSSRLAQISLDGNHGPEDFTRESHALTGQFQRVLPALTEMLPEILQHTDTRLTGFLSNGGIRTLPTASLNRIRARTQHLMPDTVRISAASELHQPSGTAPVFATAPVAETESEHLASPSSESFPVETHAAEPPAKIIASTSPASAAPFESGLLAGPAEPPLNDQWHGVLNAVRRNLGADECWHFATEAGSPVLSLAESVGTHWRALQRTARVRSDERSVFGACFTRRETVLIHDISDPKLTPILPPWLTAAEHTPRSFVLLPVCDGKRTAALVLVGWHEAHRISPNKSQLERARQALEHAFALRAFIAA